MKKEINALKNISDIEDSITADIEKPLPDSNSAQNSAYIDSFKY